MASAADSIGRRDSKRRCAPAATVGNPEITTTPPRGAELRGNLLYPSRLIVAVVAAVVVLTACLVYAVTTGGGPAPWGPPWRAVWTGDFSGRAGGAIDALAWKFDTGRGIFGTREIETMTASAGNVHVDGHGGLDIVVLRQRTPDGSGTDWTSGRIETRRLFTPPPGHEMLVTASIRQPDPAHGAGYWPAFWMLGPDSWPANGEIDILEDVNAESTHSGTLHCGDLTQRNGDGTFGPCREMAGLGSGRLPCPGCQRGFHTYSVIIDRRDEASQQIRWYFDGSQFFSVSEPRVGRAAWTSAVDHGLAIVLNVAVGGVYPDSACQCVTPDARTTPGGMMTVRDVAVYVK